MFVVWHAINSLDMSYVKNRKVVFSLFFLIIFLDFKILNLNT